ncbi:AbrB/MazE/SpoVT family DNA-binding domain-containing protein [Silvibacterium acidisoli]|uniref:AbrB/MazE/SpoVT family DNA-binding domain-containing protein n=1 Tax=Acidobacteriaceae bacterium ZG23-2 TaxID=2883246 RepID=UPI00406C5BEA
MAIATVTSKGQVTIPVKVREELGLEAGDRIDFVRNETTGHYEVIPSTVSVLSLKGILPKAKRTVSIEEMNEAIAEEGASASR